MVVSRGKTGADGLDLPVRPACRRRSPYLKLFGIALTSTSILAICSSTNAQEVNATSGTTNLNAHASYPDFNGIRAANAGTQINGSGTILLLSTSYQYGASAESGSRIELLNTTVQTSGYPPALMAGPKAFSASGVNSVLISNGFTVTLNHAASTQAQPGAGLRAVSRGLVEASNGSVNMVGSRNYGVLGVDGTVRADNVSIETNGASTYGVFAFPTINGVQTLVVGQFEIQPSNSAP